MRHFDVQMIGGMVLHDGAIAEMKTGEGKTLTATLAVVLNSLPGTRRPRRHRQRLPGPPRRDVDEADLRHARRHRRRAAEPAGPSRRRPPPTPPTSPTAPTRSSASTTCATTWPRAWRRSSSTAAVAKAADGKSIYHRFAVVDEVDNILIDEARTPLIISGAPEQAADLYAKFARLAPKMKAGKTPDGMDPRTKKEFVADFDYEFDEKYKTVSITEQGVAKAERFMGIDHLYRAENGHLVNHLHPVAEGRVAVSPRRRLRGDRRRGQDHRRAHRPHPRGPALVGGPAPGGGGQGGGPRPGGEPDAGHDHAAELLPHVRQARGDDRARRSPRRPSS